MIWNDLQDAQASVDWTVSNFAAFEERLKTWIAANLDVRIVESEANLTEDLIVAKQTNDIPLVMNAEVGAYLNALRSALDMVAWRVGKRDMVLFPKNIYFPVARSEQDFLRFNFKGGKFIRQLSRPHLEAFKALKPYEGGNDQLCWLHHLDIVRKHERLLTSYSRPKRFVISGWTNALRTIRDGEVPPKMGKNETVIGFVAKGAPRPKIKYVAAVVISEARLGAPQNVLGVLRRFANVVQAVIDAFNW